MKGWRDEGGMKWWRDEGMKDRASMVENSMMDCMFSRYIYPANGS